MGIGMNFTCTCCGYDSGILMLHQGNQSLERVVNKYIDTYTNEIDLRMQPSREEHYRHILFKNLKASKKNMTYNYFGCVCYGCNKTYEMLDLLEEKEEVYVGERILGRRVGNPIQQMFNLCPDQWSSLFGESPLCLFCDQVVEKISEERLDKGLDCPKCRQGYLRPGDEFEIWD